MSGDEAFDARLAAVLARTVAGFESTLSCERLSGGASQQTFCITVELHGGGQQKLALRRTVGDLGLGTPSAPGPATEALLMQSARAVGVPEPKVVHILTPEDELGEGFLMEWLAGETLGARIARAPDLEPVRRGLAAECGEILARIHSVDLVETGLDRRLAQITPEQYVRMTWEGYKALSTFQPMIDYTGRWLLDHLPPETPPRLVHNDFRNGNIMVGPDGVVAVLDWELAHIGDPMRDLGWICTNSWRFGVREREVGGFGDRVDLFRGYESVTGSRVDPDHVKFWEVFGSFWWSIGCLQMGNSYRSGANRTVERPGIGRRSSECQVDCVNLLIPGPVTLLTPDGDDEGGELPSAGELLTSVRDFLRDDVMNETGGRTRFLARVAGNSLDVVRREVESGEARRRAELERLRRLFASSEGRSVLRARLARELRSGSMALDHPGLAEALREAVVNQVAIDQPTYSGFLFAIDTIGAAAPR